MNILIGQGLTKMFYPKFSAKFLTKSFPTEPTLVEAPIIAIVLGEKTWRRLMELV